MNEYVFKMFQDKNVNLKSSIKEFKGIGDYLYKRLKDTLKINGTITVTKFLKKFENKSSNEITEILKLALQNKRRNQCVSVEYNSSSYKKYHTRDVNKRGYNICISILRYGKKYTNKNLTFGRLNNAIVQQEDSKHCGCMTQTQCNRSPICEYKKRYCVPKNKNTRGFEGVGQVGQRHLFTSPRQKRRLLDSVNIKKDSKFYSDPDTVSDDLLSYISPKYIEDGNNLWRKSGKTLRNPR
jgi:hypothetical protein